MKRINAPQTLTTLITDIECHLEIINPQDDSGKLLRDALPMLRVVQAQRAEVREPMGRGRSPKPKLTP